MHVPPSEAIGLTIYQYEALLVQWNENHDHDPQPDPMTMEEFKGYETFFDAHPELLN